MTLTTAQLIDSVEYQSQPLEEASGEAPNTDLLDEHLLELRRRESQGDAVAHAWLDQHGYLFDNVEEAR